MSSKAIKTVKTLISLNDLSDSLIEISEFTFLTYSITKFESQGLRLEEQLEILDSIKSKLKGNPLEKVKNCLNKILIFSNLQVLIMIMTLKCNLNMSTYSICTVWATILQFIE
jgi:hypothetical protein